METRKPRASVQIAWSTLPVLAVLALAFMLFGVWSPAPSQGLGASGAQDGSKDTVPERTYHQDFDGAIADASHAAESSSTEDGSRVSPRDGAQRPCRIDGSLETVEGAGELVGGPHCELVDNVSFWNLEPGVRYVVTASLHAADEAGADRGPLADARGKRVQAKTIFTPAGTSGQVQAKIRFDASGLAGTRIFATERLCVYKSSDVRASSTAEITGAKQNCITVIKPVGRTHAELDRSDRHDGHVAETLAAAAQSFDFVSYAHALALELLGFCKLAPWAFLGLALAYLSVRRLQRPATQRALRNPTCAPRARVSRPRVRTRQPVRLR